MFSAINQKCYPIQTFKLEMVRAETRAIYANIHNMKKTLKECRVPIHRNILAGAIRIARDEIKSRD